MDSDNTIEAALTDVADDERALVLAAAIDEVFGHIQSWDGGVEKKRALGALLLAGCEQLARGPVPSEARTAQDWMLELLERAKRAVASGFPVLLPQGGNVTLGEHHYDVRPLGARLTEPGLLTFAFEVKLTNESRYDANFWSATFRLQHSDEASAPTTFLNEVVAGRTTATAEVQFTVPADTLVATLLVGDDAATAVALPLVVVPLSG